MLIVLIMKILNYPQGYDGKHAKSPEESRVAEIVLYFSNPVFCGSGALEQREKEVVKR